MQFNYPLWYPTNFSTINGVMQPLNHQLAFQSFEQCNFSLFYPTNFPFNQSTINYTAFPSTEQYNLPLCYSDTQPGHLTFQPSNIQFNLPTIHQVIQPFKPSITRINLPTTQQSISHPIHRLIQTF